MEGAWVCKVVQQGGTARRYSKCQPTPNNTRQAERHDAKQDGGGCLHMKPLSVGFVQGLSAAHQQGKARDQTLLLHHSLLGGTAALPGTTAAVAAA